MYSNNIVNSQESTTILKCLYKKSLETYWRHHVSEASVICNLNQSMNKQNITNIQGSQKFNPKNIKQ